MLNLYRQSHRHKILALKHIEKLPTPKLQYIHLLSKHHQ